MLALIWGVLVSWPTCNLLGCSENTLSVTMLSNPPLPTRPFLPSLPQQVSHDKESTTVSYLEYFDVSQPERVAALLERAMKARR